MTDQKRKSEYEEMKAKAPAILTEMAQMLNTWRKMGFHVPRGVKNIFEFTWDEFDISFSRKSFSGIYCPIVKFASFDEISSSSNATSRAQKFGPSISGTKPNYMTASFENQQMLLKFQQRSVHLLTELLKMKMKIMIDSVAGKIIEISMLACRRNLESNLWNFRITWVDLSWNRTWGNFLMTASIHCKKHHIPLYDLGEGRMETDKWAKQTIPS